MTKPAAESSTVYDLLKIKKNGCLQEGRVQLPLPSCASCEDLNALDPQCGEVQLSLLMSNACHLSQPAWRLVGAKSTAGTGCDTGKKVDR